MNATEILRKAGLKDRNMMTPDILSVVKLNDDSAAELSHGRGLFGSPVWGVTVVWHGERFGHDYSQMFYSEDEARAYIQELKAL